MMIMNKESMTHFSKGEERSLLTTRHAMKEGKIMIEDLKHKFESLSDEEKIEFMKACNMDMQGMMKMMGMMAK